MLAFKLTLVLRCFAFPSDAYADQLLASAILYVNKNPHKIAKAILYKDWPNLELAFSFPSRAFCFYGLLGVHHCFLMCMHPHSHPN